MKIMRAVANSRITEDVKESVVGTSGNQPPMTAVTKKDEIIGLDADFAREMAAAMNVGRKFVAMPFAEFLPALEAGKVDMVLSVIK